jgi:hypothetical protein
MEINKKKLAWGMQAIRLLSYIELIMKTIEVTQEEIYQATRPNIYRNRKKYTRKDKHRNKSIED